MKPKLTIRDVLESHDVNLALKEAIWRALEDGVSRALSERERQQRSKEA